MKRRRSGSPATIRTREDVLLEEGPQPLGPGSRNREVPSDDATSTLCRGLAVGIAFLGLMAGPALAQLDPDPRSLLHLGIDQPVTGLGPQSVYAYYYYNGTLPGQTNRVLRAALAPVFFDGELGFRGLLSPATDVGLGIHGGGFGENYFEMRRGHYVREESFDGHGGGASLRWYHQANPGRRIPFNLVVQGGPHFSTFSRTGRTDDAFVPPEDRIESQLRAGFRFGGSEPMLYPDLSMEVSAWVERRWRSGPDTYGYGNSLRVRPATDLWWLHGGLNYAWPDSGQQMVLSITAGDSAGADRFSAWRLGGVLPLAAELPLALPGYYYQELSATRFLHLGASYVLPLSASHRWQLRLGAAGANLRYLPGLEQSGSWQAGLGPALEYTSRSEVWRIVVRYGYGVFAQRNGSDGAQSVGLLYQYNFERRSVRREAAP